MFTAVRLKGFLLLMVIATQVGAVGAPVPVPEPATYSLMAFGVMALLLRKRK